MRARTLSLRDSPWRSEFQSESISVSPSAEFICETPLRFFFCPVSCIGDDNKGIRAEFLMSALSRGRNPKMPLGKHVDSIITWTGTAGWRCFSVQLLKQQTDSRKFRVSIFINVIRLKKIPDVWLFVICLFVGNYVMYPRALLYLGAERRKTAENNLLNVLCPVFDK